MRALLLAVVPALAGCGAGQQFVTYAEATRDVLEVAEPCLVAAKERDIASCASAPNVELCEMQAQSMWEPTSDALDLIHQLWCQLSGNGEGC